MGRSGSGRSRTTSRVHRAIALWTATGSLVLLTAGCATTAPDRNRLPTTPPATPVVLSAHASDAPPDDEESLVTATPDAHSEVGDLVAGFPRDIVPIPDDAVILVTSAVPMGSGNTTEISLNLHTALTTEQVLALYRTHLTAEGFTEVPEVDTSLPGEASFTRSGGDELVSVGVLDKKDRRTVTIGGRVHVGG
jgi:hypothetical protein